MSMSIPVPNPAEQSAEVTSTQGALIARRASLKADQEYIAEQIAEIDAQLIRQLPVGSHDVDGVKVQIREYSRLSYPQIEADYPAADYPDLYVTKTSIDQTAVKKAFAPDALEQYKVTGARSVVI